MPPRLIDVSWGDRSDPKVTVVGKGVTFDTGGLNIKPDAAMALMKKDMGGAAAALAVAQMVMDAQLPVRLGILVPAVENAISGSSFRPGDVLKSHKGLSVEIGNTDAEGRLILADALALADAEAPDLLVDYATLTGAARVALGPDLPALYTRDETLAADIARIGGAVNDPVWRMPLWAPYDQLLDVEGGGRQSHLERPACGIDHGGALPQSLRRDDLRVRAFRHLRLDADRKARPPGGRRGAGGAPGLRAHQGALRRAPLAQSMIPNLWVRRTPIDVRFQVFIALRFGGGIIRFRNEVGGDPHVHRASTAAGPDTLAPRDAEPRA